MHTARLIKRWLNDWEVRHIGNWPSKSPDLNPIENLWGILARKVYPNCKQYTSKEELKTAIIEAWDSIDQETIESLVASMPRRIHAVLDVNGNSTKY